MADYYHDEKTDKIMVKDDRSGAYKAFPKEQPGFAGSVSEGFESQNTRSVLQAARDSLNKKANKNSGL